RHGLLRPAAVPSLKGNTAQFTARRLRRRIAPKFSVIFSKNARQSTKDCLRFLVHLTKNFLARSTTWN
ncbi:hypothetical protein, partial [Allofournierella sp.]|uniref:hypothetical protein n=1 Tax=Allofournierella sp. TaxID=1940256 RepID=UPI002E7645B4